eukprot:7676148-Pyramimonas_sp.AAC.1
MVASMRKLRITVEQPLNSFLYRVPSIEFAIRASGLRRMVLWMGGWGGNAMTPDEFYTSLAPHGALSLH